MIIPTLNDKLAYLILRNDAIYDIDLSVISKDKILNLIRQYNLNAILISTSSFPAYGEIITYPCEEGIKIDFFGSD